MEELPERSTTIPIPRPAATTTIATNMNISELLQNDSKVKVAGIDSDGVLRGKLMSKDKFLASLGHGFGMSSAIFGWDMHDVLYTSTATATATSDPNPTPAEIGYADFIAVVDLGSFRRIPWEDDIPFFLLRFNSASGVPVHADGRGMLRSINDKLQKLGYSARAGVELEFMNFQTPAEDGYGQGQRRDLAAFLDRNTPGALRPLTQGMFGYSLTRQAANKGYFHDIFDQASRFKCNVEGWHTESGPGVFEAALAVTDTQEMADRVTLFKYLTKSIGVDYDITPCFMAKPTTGLPGNSGHIHISLCDAATGSNLFARGSADPDAPWSDVEHVSDLGRHFLAGVLEALPDMMPMLAPTVNSYKRLVENYWAPVDISWGLEDRRSSIRLIAPPVSSPQATRLECRIPGADLHPHYALTAIVAAGLRGIRKKLAIPVPPTAVRTDTPERLPDSLAAANARFRAPASVARDLFPPDFVDFFAASRDHEIRVFRESVTDWEFRRYIETV
ncbi:glutamine synthetase [Capronia epimyces CBS 606.96]|uniref:Glutamine synthetase n=1 Tax=Capronia epimyces CBS 606.96 TaxID=1182542 RepID=W9XYC4_9EURO|nr:glutamine synthetase [Capronia epimyces CBS 606.96]EXJ85263.1 glutamine synthetase [Capronia epimyces CBS 606.96]